MKQKAIVIFSGGQDSTTCLFWALKTFQQVEAITFDYGQNHKIELAQSELICRSIGVKQTIIDISFLGTIVESAMTSGGDTSQMKNGLPASFVPNRNALFITLAHAYAQKVGNADLVGGMCETDYSGYPDCRADFMARIEDALNNGSGAAIQIYVPLMYLNKAETFGLADDLGMLKTVIEYSHTCYKGVRSELHAWGYGCGECPACILRKKGYETFLEEKNRKLQSIS